jgi:hypothetical protein
MLEDSRTFLIEEYRALWRYVEYVDGLRNRAVALYLATLGAVTTGVLSQVEAAQWKTGSLRTFLVSIPGLYLLPAAAFTTIVSIFVLMLSISYRSLFIEYTYSVNRIRRAFDRQDDELRPHLVLPVQMPFVRPGRWGAAWRIHTFVNIVGAVVLFVGVMAVLYRLNLYWMTPVAAGLASVAWVVGFDRWYVHDERKVLNELWKRCGSAVKDEIAEEAHRVWLEAGDDRVRNWLQAEKEVRRRWGKAED